MTTSAFTALNTEMEGSGSGRRSSRAIQSLRIAISERMFTSIGMPMFLPKDEPIELLVEPNERLKTLEADSETLRMSASSSTLPSLLPEEEEEEEEVSPHPIEVKFPHQEPRARRAPRRRKSKLLDSTRETKTTSRSTSVSRTSTRKSKRFPPKSKTLPSGGTKEARLSQADGRNGHTSRRSRPISGEDRDDGSKRRRPRRTKSEEFESTPLQRNRTSRTKSEKTEKLAPSRRDRALPQARRSHGSRSRKEIKSGSHSKPNPMDGGDRQRKLLARSTSFSRSSSDTHGRRASLEQRWQSHRDLRVIEPPARDSPPARISNVRPMKRKPRVRRRLSSRSLLRQPSLKKLAPSCHADSSPDPAPSRRQRPALTRQASSTTRMPRQLNRNMHRFSTSSSGVNSISSKSLKRLNDSCVF